ncbi:peptidase M3 [archaeon]|nr:MAG: peptidase M3 [archaeon]
MSVVNPLLEDWSKKNYGLPSFDEIKPGMFEEALNVSMQMQLQELAAITSNSQKPTFENTILPFDKCGSLFSQVNDCFSNLCSSMGVTELQEVELKMASPLAAHYNRVLNFPGLFERIDAVYQERNQLGLDPMQIRLVERFHLDAVRAGAKFSAEDKAKYEHIIEELAALQTKFTQNVMADEAEIFLEIDDFSGLPEDLALSAKQAAQERGVTGEAKGVITLSRSLVEPFLTFSERRDLREQAWRLWTRRGELNPQRANLPIAKRILELRRQQAKLHGYKNFGEYATADTMAGSPTKVQGLLEEVWTRAKESIGHEQGELERLIASLPAEQRPDALQPWDWRFFSEKVRQTNYELDMGEVKPFFPLDSMVQGLFDTAKELFGLRFVLRPDLKAYHEDVQVYEVYRGDNLVSLFLHDNFARMHKRSGAWMSELRTQAYEGSQRLPPIVLNNNNFNKPPPGEDCLLSYDDAVTLFHEFGHGLHGMLSDVPYRRLASTNVLRDFVELPSQLFEHWLGEDEVLNRHARHHVTKASLPAVLLNKLRGARTFGQGFATIEFTASALLDARLHQEQEPEHLDLSDWEKVQLDGLGMPQAIVMRHRLPHFQRKLLYFTSYFLRIYISSVVVVASYRRSYLSSVIHSVNLISVSMINRHVL